MRARYAMGLRHVPTKDGRRCVTCVQDWPCMVATARDGIVELAQGNITEAELLRRVDQRERELSPEGELRALWGDR